MPSNEMKAFPEVEKYLLSLRNRGSKYGIDRMRLLLAALDHPERVFPIIHVAGTNGKGSVCAMMEGILRGSGLKVGMLTSPHLIRLGERIQVNRRAIADEEIASLTKRLKPMVDQLAASDPENQPSFFELIIGMGFMTCQREKVDVAVVETGLGGRLDATNVVEPILSIITSVGLDHVAHLGNDLRSIAKEKAGIVKPNAPVVIGRMPAEAKEEILEIASGREARVFEVENIFPHAPDDLPKTNLEGTFQRWNAGTALVASKVLEQRFGLNDSSVRQPLATVEWGGR
ncbi:MAG: bifunctional folylpolyglutamate synthase/dihydrofolate synthase, partial [Opitutales bacterium]